MMADFRQSRDASRWSSRTARAARNRWLPQGRRGPMPWIIGIMIFLTLLAAAAMLSLHQGLTRMHGALAGGYTVQIVEADAARRTDQAHRVAALLRADKTVRTVAIVPEEELRAQLQPWIGTDSPPDELPIPAMIDFEAAPGATPAQMQALSRQIGALSPAARIDAHEQYLGPVERLMRALMWLAGGLVILMISVTAAVVMLAARSALATHRATIDIMHLLGATDIQIARLFQRRMAIDAMFGGVLGLGAAGLMLSLLGSRLIAIDAELAGMMTLPPLLALLLLLIPIGGVLLAMLTARITVRRALERSL